MEKISSQTIDRIKSVADIVDVVGDFVNLRKRGVNYVGLCPFHEDRSPSMCVSRAKQMYKCFACGEGGDVITFVMKIENLSYPQALHWLAKKYHIEIEQIELTTEEREADKQRQNLILINEQAQRIFSENLKSNIEQQNYLCKIRGIDADILKKYSAGFADGGNQLLQRLTQNLGQNADNLILTGVCGKSETSGKPYDKFQNRITFPFYSISGQIIGFTGRDILGKENTAKYLNTAETPLFTKGKNFFGLFQAKNAICKANEAIIVEGQFDVLSMVQKGFPNTICGSGTALTEEQAKLIHRFAEHATLIYDADTAGINASFKNCKTLLANNIKVKLVDLPAGEDPDTFAQKMDAENLKKYIKNHAKTPVQYFFNLWKEDLNDAYKKENALNQICDLISAVQEKTLKKSFINEAQAFFNVDISDIMAKFKVPVKVPDEWKTGFYGIEEAEDLLKTEPFADFICHITFSTEYFYQKIGEIPIILCVGVPLKTQIQQLRVKINSLQINSLIDLTVGKIESDSILALKELWRQRFHIKYIDLCENEILFIDYYIELYSFFKTSEDKLELRKIDEAIIYDRCVEMMSFAEPTKRTVSLKNWQQKLDLPNSQALTNLLKPYLAKNKDKAVLETQRLDVEADLFNFDPEKIPEYVLEDDLMSKTYRQSGFYPLLNAQKLPVAYMFKNQNGGGHTCVSDFYMIPLLHVYSKDQQANKRVIQLNHLYMPKTKYVEWQSSVFANFGKVQERLIDEGAYNFEGNLLQFKKIWKAMSYNFTICQELRVFGQQSEEFFAFSNAILHEIDGIYKVERMNELGVVAHREQNYYSPAFSNIYASSRLESDPYEQDRNLIFKEIHGNEQLSFEQWAKLMNDVYKVNDNGKWGTLFAILAAFRDYIYDHRKYFTSLFFIGPTGSGKTQIAESIRNLFMDSKTPSFNLNTGTDAAFFMLLERMRNIIIVMEEYNDNTISAVKFQGLKSATLDGEGKIKVKDVANKIMDSSKINAIPLILGQEAAQQDDGSLSNRCIICEVPLKTSGDFTEEEKAIYEKLKEHERIGLTNIAIDLLKLRPLIKKHFIEILINEAKLLKDAVKINIVNIEGLNRIVNSISLITACCKFMEIHAPHLKLPFTYAEFFDIACQKVLKQVELISSSNKLSTYFNTISLLLNQNTIKIGRELKISQPTKVQRLLSGKVTEELQLQPSETKVLFINFEDIYNLYIRSVGDKEALSRQSLKSYFESNQAYLGLCKNTQFKWQVVKEVPANNPIYDISGTLTNSVDMRKIVIWEKKITSAYMFNYDKLVELMSIDFEREYREENDNEKTENNENTSDEDLINNNINFSEQSKCPF